MIDYVNVKYVSQRIEIALDKAAQKYTFGVSNIFRNRNHVEELPFQKIYLYKRVVQAKLFIDSHYSENIDLTKIADEAYFSKFHFIRLFRKIYGRTPHHYLTHVRIGHARLLLTQNILISEVCFQVGFTSTTSFTALFRKSTGMSPSAYQQSQHQRKTAIAARPLQFVPNCFAETQGWI